MLEQDSQKMKWRLALRIATSPSERWLIKLLDRTQNSAQNTGPTERLEDQGKDGKMTSTNSSNLLRKRENLTKSSNQINKTWINTAKDRGRWALLEKNYTMTSEERHENNTRKRIISHNRPARYVNEVRLSDEEAANTT